MSAAEAGAGRLGAPGSGAVGIGGGPGTGSRRVLYLHQHYSGPGGATATRSHAMAAALAARGHRVTLACGRYEGAATGLSGPFRNGRRSGRVGGFTVVEFDIPCGNNQRLRARGLSFARFAARAAALAMRDEWDVVLASSTPLTVAVPALLARWRRGTPFVFEIRDPWPELPRALLAGRASGASRLPASWALAGMERLAGAACREAAAVIGLTEGMADTALARGADPARVHVVPNGCDLDLFGPQVAPWRPPGVAPWECLAVYAGAHGRANGLDLLLDAAAALRARGEGRVRILLVGDGGEKPRLRAAAAQRGLDNLGFLDPLPKTELAALLAGSQVVLHCLADVPEFAEWTAPNKLMDGLAAGRPVVSNVPGRAARLLEAAPAGAAPSGIAVPPADPDALAAALAFLAADPARREAMGRAARAQAVARWDRRLQARRLCEVVEAAVFPAPRPTLAMVPA
ncbi:glycosyltransferase family 4 protein [Roseomonas sp. BN140053]|uniref:glycosyltransferase family 4 protein n=1 Tax=Roseomonas sp. BN140053 TaxID=3391898 RepID=UPI0039E88D36